jgi:catechol 2,3-dioxygenase-like lactoylglutathione lyase family enzyme
MNRSLGLIAIVVRDYDEAIRFYADSLGFELMDLYGNLWDLLQPKT